MKGHRQMSVEGFPVPQERTEPEIEVWAVGSAEAENQVIEEENRCTWRRTICSGPRARPG